MFRLKEQQLHMLMWMMVAAAVLFFGILGIDRAISVDGVPSWKGMDDFSDGWICTYETTDLEKLEAYQREKQSPETGTGDQEMDDTIIDVVTFPAVLSVQDDTTVTMLHKVPTISRETMYVTLETDDAYVKVWIDDTVIYTSGTKEQMVPVRHVIAILPEYKDKMMTIELSGIASEKVEIEGIQSGTYNALWVTTLQEDGISLIIGLLLLCMGVCMLAVWVMTKNTWQQRRLLLYSSLEGLLFGILFLLDGETICLVTGWNYGIHLLKACAILIAIVLHLTIIRCFIYKKKVLVIVDSTILLVGIFYISVLVLQMFSLVQFDWIYQIGSVLYGIMVLMFTIILAITIFDYRRKEGMPIFVANVILLLSMITQIIFHLVGRQMNEDLLYVRIGFFLYMLYIWGYGLKQALYVQLKGTELDTERIKTQILERINPNLLFASFYTLQGFIKNSSDKSVKMIYYISAYFRDNMKALESEDEVISFKDELEHIIAYLQLQKMRNPQLDFAIECKVKEFHILRNTLEPLVENAVKHGIAKNGNQGNVVIRTYNRADGYAIQIIDDGAGFDTGILKKKATTLTKKLTLLEQSYKARTEVISKEGKGTVITIVLPMLENDLMNDLDD